MHSTACELVCLDDKGVSDVTISIMPKDVDRSVLLRRSLIEGETTASARLPFRHTEVKIWLADDPALADNVHELLAAFKVRLKA